MTLQEFEEWFDVLAAYCCLNLQRNVLREHLGESKDPESDVRKIAELEKKMSEMIEEWEENKCN